MVELENVFLSISLASRIDGVTHLHANPDILHGLIQHTDPEIGMISLQIKDESSDKSDIAIFEFPNIRECLEQIAVNLAVQLRPDYKKKTS